MSTSKLTLIDPWRSAAEVVILVMACLSPWAIGAVDAWAQLILDAGLVLLAVLGLLAGGRTGWAQRLFCIPSLALAGLALLALAQSLPLPGAVLSTIAPATQAWRVGLVPEVPQGVQADAHPSVQPPAATLSHNPDASLGTAARLAAAWLLFQAILGSAKGDHSFRRFGLFTVANASLLTIFSIVQALAWNGKIYGVRETVAWDGWYVGGPFVSHNHLAAYLNLAFGLSLGLLLATIQKPPRSVGPQRRRLAVESTSLWAGAGAGLIFAGILASHSRGGFLAAVGSTTVVLILLRPRSIRLGPALAVTVLVTALFLIVMGMTSPLERLASIKDASHDGFSGRTQVWGIALRTWRSFPLWGTGMGTFPTATASYYRQQFFASYFSHAESEYLQMLTEGGVVGLALALLAMVTIARLGKQALDAAATPQARALVLGALASGLALLIQCLSDFPLHIPGVAVTAVVVAGHLCRMGLEAREREATPLSNPARLGPLLGGLAMVGLGVVLVVAGVRLARAEALVRSVGLPFPDAYMPTVDPARLSDPELKQTRSALEAALRLRPNWAEGHVRLGAVQLGLYSNSAQALLGELQGEKDADAFAVLSDPLWLHGVAHSASAQDLAELGGVLDHEPVRNHLVPAARCFLEARRCNPDLALAHARLAELDYLIAKGESTVVHATRALHGTGYDHRVLVLAGQTAAQAGDINLAARCWRKALAIHDESWLQVVLSATAVMTPEQILDQVLPPGARFPLLLAEEFYTAPEAQETRDQFLRAAIVRLPDDPEMTPEDRLWLESQIRANLGERDIARKMMNQALQGDSDHPEWRETLIDWLIVWGDLDEASRQARIGLTLHPNHPGIQRGSQLARDAFAQGKGGTDPPN